MLVLSTCLIISTQQTDQQEMGTVKRMLVSATATVCVCVCVCVCVLYKSGMRIVSYSHAKIVELVTNETIFERV